MYDYNISYESGGGGQFPEKAWIFLTGSARGLSLPPARRRHRSALDHGPLLQGHAL